MIAAALKVVLLVEDNPGDALLMREMLVEHGANQAEITHVETMGELEKHVAGNTVDVILLDLGLPDAQGLEAVKRAHAAAPRVALVVLTGLDDDILSVQALQEGAQDYLVKGQIDPRGLIRAMRYSIERKIMEDALFEAKERAQVTLNSIGDGVICTDVAGNITFLNRVAELITGWAWQDANGKAMGDVVLILDAATREPIANPIARAVRKDEAVHLPDNSILVR